MRFHICPDCGNDRLKVKSLEKRTYDPASTRVTVEEEVEITEYHCPTCGWNILVEDSPVYPSEEALRTS